MRFTKPSHLLAGVSVPVQALRTSQGCGTGEFADLAAFGEWCASAGLPLIQILPVNDTGWNSSPYSALSAFALHPLYLRLTDVPGCRPFAPEVRAFAEAAAARRRLSYRETLAFKLSIVGRIFEGSAAEIRQDPAFARWRRANPWAVAYAVFTALKKERESSPWSSWPSPLRDPSAGDIAAWHEAHEEQCLLHEWTQYLLEGQLSVAAGRLQDMGISLKGDIPILMSEESVDVWASRRYFDLSSRAGAPPDMYSTQGQNWGFPVYDWQNLAEDGYCWWKQRLAQAAKFFHAFRIDHVLGFFRIWAIPRGETSGLLGRFSPAVPIPRVDLRAQGFDDERIRWLSVPHISGASVSAALGPDAGRAAGLYLDRIAGEDLYNLKPDLDSETSIRSLAEPAGLKDFLLSAHADRALLPAGSALPTAQGRGVDGRAADAAVSAFLPAWYCETSTAFRSLSESEKSLLRKLAVRSRAQSEEVWEKRGRELLAMLRDTTDMLVCAEDLGDVPACVPRVLSELSILGLRIERWSREYGSPGAPFIAPARYPRLSVCTPSVHDTSTLRAWWEEDPVQRGLFFATLGATGPCPPRLTRDLLQRILEGCLDSGSLLCVFQLQELLDLDEELWSDDPREDRINVPGTIAETNWTWRMPILLEELAARKKLTGLIRSMTGRRSGRSA
jgi:4-alpha-glucanotransferase